MTQHTVEQCVLNLRSRTAIVTGASSGIGRSVALRFAQYGARLVLVGRDKGKLEETGAMISGLVREATEFLIVTDDLEDPESPRRIVDASLSQYDRLDILVNNAATIYREPPGEEFTPVAAWDAIMRVNVRSYYLLAKAAFPHLCKTRGSIVNMSSIWALVGARNQAAYSVSKAAIVELTRSLALDFAHAGVRVNCVCPSTTRTPLLLKSRDSFDEESAARSHPLGRIGEPDDVAKAILFLASEAASWVTGVALPVDGGYTIQ
jgi:NAD(P)-dependent dehydrogenase (short-subunit alcohol dehydrogenase family)